MSGKPTDIPDRNTWLDCARMYLSTRGWQSETESATRTMLVFSKQTSAGDAVAWLPARTDLRDFADAQHEFIQAVAAVEQRSFDDVAEDVSHVFFDRVVVRVAGTDTSDGTIAALDGRRVIDAALSAATTSAWALEREAPVLVGGLPKRVAEYQRALRLGQTRRGSFIVSVFSPLRLASEPVEPTLPLLGEAFNSTGFPRLAARQLIAQASAAREIANTKRTTEAELLQLCLEARISANMLEAVGALAANAEDEVNIGVTLSLAAREQYAIRSVVMTSEEARVMRACAALMRVRLPVRRTIEGLVVQLNRRSAAFGDKVEIATVIDGRELVISTQLFGGDYDLALRLLRARSRISVTGDVVRKGRWVLLNAANVRAADPDEFAQIEEAGGVLPLSETELDDQVSVQPELFEE